MNKAHERCGSDEWRQAIREVILPWALGDTDLGDDVLEVGPGYGATTDVLSQAVPRLTSVEIDDELAAMLTDRFADVPSVEIVNGDATSLSYADNRFSGAACFTMLHHVPTVELAGSAVRRGGPGAAARRCAGRQRQPGQRRAGGPPRGRHLQPRRPGDPARPAGRGRIRRRRRCASTSSAGRSSRASPTRVAARSRGRCERTCWMPGWCAKNSRKSSGGIPHPAAPTYEPDTTRDVT